METLQNLGCIKQNNVMRLSNCQYLQQVQPMKPSIPYSHAKEHDIFTVLFANCVVFVFVLV